MEEEPNTLRCFAVRKRVCVLTSERVHLQQSVFPFPTDEEEEVHYKQGREKDNSVSSAM